MKLRVHEHLEQGDCTVLFKRKRLDTGKKLRAVRRPNIYIADDYNHTLSEVATVIDRRPLTWFKYSRKSIVSVILTHRGEMFGRATKEFSRETPPRGLFDEDRFNVT